MKLRLLDDSVEIIFAQRSPASAIFAQEYTSGRCASACNREAIKIVRDIGLTPETRTWIVHGLWAMLSRTTAYTYCQNENGRPLHYDDSTLNSTFREELIKVWPTVNKSKIEDKHWEEHYVKYGCCIQLTSLSYFKDAITLMDNNNVGKILESTGVIPGGTYELSRIFNSVKSHFGVDIYVRCLPDKERSNQQYLLDVQICYNIQYKLKNCNYATIHRCREEKSVFYPGI